MQTQILEKEATHAKFKVEVSADEVKETFEKIYRVLAQQVKVPGFRPGKAPRNMIENRVGKDAIAQEVRDALVEKYYPKAIVQLQLEPIAVHPHAHEPVEGEDYTFEVMVDLYPEFELPDISQIVIDTEKRPVSDEMFEATLAQLATENATLVPVERAVEAGDVVMIETEQGSTMPIDLESVSPALAEQFLGKSIGDSFTLSFSTADDDDDDDFDDEDDFDNEDEDDFDDEDETVLSDGAESSGEDTAETGSEASDAEGDEAVSDDDDADDALPSMTSLSVTVRDIKAKEKPEMDDDFAKTLGFDAWADAALAIRRSLQAQLDYETFNEQREEFIEKLLAESDFDLPKSLIEERKRQLLGNLERDLSQRGMPMKAYVEKLEADGNREQFEGELEEAATKGVRRDLVLEKLLEERGSTVSDAEFEAALAYMAQQQKTNAAKLRKDFGQQGLANYRFMLARDKAVRETLQELLGETPDESLEAESEASPEANIETAEAAVAE